LLSSISILSHLLQEVKDNGQVEDSDMLTNQEVRLAFALSQQEADHDGTRTAELEEMTFVEFLEAMVRIALFKWHTQPEEMRIEEMRIEEMQIEEGSATGLNTMEALMQERRYR
jgi:hypothetical protein